MPVELDHLILPVNDRAKSLAFYGDILGFAHEGDDGSFAMLRVSPGFMLLIAQWGTKGGEHLAFSMSEPEFNRIFARLKARAIPYGDAFDQVGNMKGPGRERGARGTGQALYSSIRTAIFWRSATTLRDAERRDDVAASAGFPAWPRRWREHACAIRHIG